MAKEFAQLRPSLGSPNGDVRMWDATCHARDFTPAPGERAQGCSRIADATGAEVMRWAGRG